MAMAVAVKSAPALLLLLLWTADLTSSQISTPPSPSPLPSLEADPATFSQIWIPFPPSPSPSPDSSPAGPSSSPAGVLRPRALAAYANANAREAASDSMLSDVMDETEGASSRVGIAAAVMAAAGLVWTGTVVYQKRRPNIRRVKYGSATRREILRK